MVQCFHPQTLNCWHILAFKDIVLRHLLVVLEAQVAKHLALTEVPRHLVVGNVWTLPRPWIRLLNHCSPVVKRSQR